MAHRHGISKGHWRPAKIFAIYRMSKLHMAGRSGIEHKVSFRVRIWGGRPISKKMGHIDGWILSRSGSLCVVIPFGWAFIAMVPLAGPVEFGNPGQGIDNGVLTIEMTCAFQRTSTAVSEPKMVIVCNCTYTMICDCV